MAAPNVDGAQRGSLQTVGQPSPHLGESLGGLRVFAMNLLKLNDGHRRVLDSAARNVGQDRLALALMSAVIQAHGAEVIFLPCYSPDFNPIEGSWSKLEAYLRKIAARTPETLDCMLARGLTLITPRNACGWSKRAGYRTG